MTPPGLEPRLLDPETSTLTISGHCTSTIFLHYMPLNHDAFFSIDCFTGNDPMQVIALASYNRTIQSVYYPLDYHNSAECKWRVKIEDKLDLPFGGYIIKVIFNDFELQTGQDSSVPSCPYDNLTFYDGYSVASPLLGSYCGTVHPEVIYSTGSYLYIKLRTDSTITSRGFRISVSVVGVGTNSKHIRLSLHTSQ